MKELGNIDKPEIGRWASNSSASRKLSLNRKHSHKAWQMTSAGNRWHWNEISFTKHHPHERLTLSGDKFALAGQNPTSPLQSRGRPQMTAPVRGIRAPDKYSGALRGPLHFPRPCQSRRWPSDPHSATRQRSCGCRSVPSTSA
jgi:hypothetical protein